MIYETALAVSRENILKDVDQIFKHWTDGTKHLISHYLSPIEFRQRASFTGTDHELIECVKNYPSQYAAIYVVSDHDLTYDMQEIRPSLSFYRLVVKDADTIIQKQNNNGTGQIGSRRELALAWCD